LSKDCFGDLARLLTEFLGESQGAVGLGVGTFAGTDDWVDASATSDSFESCLQGARKNEQRVGAGRSRHNPSIVADSGGHEWVSYARGTP
jgi:hypothetical protein